MWFVSKRRCKLWLLAGVEPSVQLHVHRRRRASQSRPQVFQCPRDGVASALLCQHQAAGGAASGHERGMAHFPLALLLLIVQHASGGHGLLYD